MTEAGCTLGDRTLSHNEFALNENNNVNCIAFLEKFKTLGEL
jgi:hypothetical protein